MKSKILFGGSLMKSRLYVLALLALISETEASRTRPSTEWQTHTIPLPIMTFDMIEENGLVDQKWGTLEIEGRQWHLHWAIENRASLLETFPQDDFIYPIRCVDFSGLENRGVSDSLFATYELLPLKKTLQDGLFKEEPKTYLGTMYSFFLSPSNHCLMNHSEKSS